MVVEIPKGMGPGTVDDAFFRFVVDMGAPGPDAGKGGKYIIAFEGDKSVLPKEGYFIARTPSYLNLLILRGFLVDGKPDTARQTFKKGLKIYPLKDADNPSSMHFINLSKKPINTIHANDETFFEELNTAIQREPLGFISPQLRGLFASIGIEKGLPFKPDARMQKILKEAAELGNATVRTLSFANRNPKAFLFPNSQWQNVFGDNYQWLKNEGRGGRDIDARAAYFYVATVNTPAMTKKMVGKGSQYAVAYKDKTGKYLDGAKQYALTIPAKVPAKDFWSVVIYDPQTRSELQTSQPFPSKNSKRDQLIANADGSVTLFCGPKPIPGKEANWIQTVSGKGWFPVLRLYGPLQPWFDKAWKPGDLEEMKSQKNASSGKG
jgi:hypothetical protein